MDVTDVTLTPASMGSPWPVPRGAASWKRRERSARAVSDSADQPFRIDRGLSSGPAFSYKA